MSVGATVAASANSRTEVPPIVMRPSSDCRSRRIGNHW
jgi:hypothetical protein